LVIILLNYDLYMNVVCETWNFFDGPDNDSTQNLTKNIGEVHEMHLEIIYNNIY